MKQIILGTAGHIDHGKTALIQALTGIDTDRLKEEKARGITIELGFANLVLPNGQHLGIVDVPGHERFVKNMVAGATGIDLVMMVVAADEGVMPQTREHTDICSLLGIKHGLVALTKKDLVDEAWLELVTDDVTAFVQGTFLEEAPVVPVSSTDASGLEALADALETVAGQIPERSDSGFFRLPIDRVFTMKGFGTVITGTLTSGTVTVGDPVMLYPSRETSKVRGIQVHSQSVEQAHAGQRTAINFQGLSKEAASRGDVLAHADTLEVSYMIDARLHCLDSLPKPLKNRVRLRVHTGTSEIMGVLILLDREELAPGDTAVVQLRLENPVAVVAQDRFVVRSYSPVRTVGGGTILNPMAPKRKRLNNETITALSHLAEGDPNEVVRQNIRDAGVNGVSFGVLRIMTNLPEKKLAHLLDPALSRKEIVLIDKETRLFMHQAHVERVGNRMLATLQAYHQKNPLKTGVSKEELKSKFPRISSKLFTLKLNQLAREKNVVVDEKVVRLASHKAALGVDENELRQKIVSICKDAALTPPSVKDLVKMVAAPDKTVQELLAYLVETGELIKVKEGLFYDRYAVGALRERLVSFLQEKGEISTPEFKNMTGASRKYVIPLIEYFDHQHVTIRIGDIRKLRKA